MKITAVSNDMEVLYASFDLYDSFLTINLYTLFGFLLLLLLLPLPVARQTNTLLLVS